MGNFSFVREKKKKKKEEKKKSRKPYMGALHVGRSPQLPLSSSLLSDRTPPLPLATFSDTDVLPIAVPSLTQTLSLSLPPSPSFSLSGSVFISPRTSTAFHDQAPLVVGQRHALARAAQTAATKGDPMGRWLKSDGSGAWAAHREPVGSWRWIAVLLPFFMVILGANKFLLTSSLKSTLRSEQKCLNHRHAFLCRNDKFCQWIWAKQSLILQ